MGICRHAMTNVCKVGLHTVGVLMHSEGVRSPSSNLVTARMASAIAPFVTEAHSSDSLP